MNRCSWLLPVLLLMAAGCGRSKPAPHAEEISFRVDSTRLGVTFSDAHYGLALRAPAHWESLPRDAIDEGARRMRAAAGPDSAREPRLLAIYREEPEGATLAISGFAGEISPPAFDSLGPILHTRLQSQTPDARVDQGRFTYRGLDVLQFRVVDAREVHFKLLIRRPRTAPFQLDYVVPRGVYERELESIESSIGSLRPMS